MLHGVKFFTHLYVVFQHKCAHYIYDAFALQVIRFSD